MRKVDIVRRIAEETACTTARAEHAVAAILAVKEGLQQGDTVILRRFGTFHMRAKRARVGRSPRSGDAAAMPPGGLCASRQARRSSRLWRGGDRRE